jgi:lipopolysaccharide/colanic/teichoic acid biosynthesis glycosyltransferase
MQLEQAQVLTLVHPQFRRRTLAELVPKRWRRIYFYAAALAIDCLIILGAFMAGNAIRFGTPLARDGLNLFAVLVPFYIVMGLHQNNYGSDLLTEWRRSALRAVTSFITAIAAVGFIAFCLRGSALVSREMLLWGFGISLVLLIVSRYVMRRCADRVFGGSPLSELLICDGVSALPLPGMTAIDARTLDLELDITDPHMLDRLGRLLKRADRVVVACPHDRRAAWAIALKGANIRGELLTPEMDGLGPLGSGRFGDETTLMVSVGPLSMPNRALKRGLDLTIALAALITLAPLMALVALAVKLESEGPVFFVQSRLGRGNRLFPMYKFRSMKAELCDAEGKQSTSRTDKRVTRVGKIIRATSIDELPQIINVLKGDMSFVGPRPHALGSLAGDKLFWEIDQRYWHRHTTKPGITGLAQVRGFRGATLIREDLVNRLQADLDYLNGWTIWRDVAILFATFRVLLHKNAY